MAAIVLHKPHWLNWSSVGLLLWNLIVIIAQIVFFILKLCFAFSKICLTIFFVGFFSQGRSRRYNTDINYNY